MDSAKHRLACPMKEVPLVEDSDSGSELSDSLSTSSSEGVMFQSVLGRKYFCNAHNSQIWYC